VKTRSFQKAVPSTEPSFRLSILTNALRLIAIILTAVIVQFGILVLYAIGIWTFEYIAIFLYSLLAALALFKAFKLRRYKNFFNNVFFTVAILSSITALTSIISFNQGFGIFDTEYSILDCIWWFECWLFFVPYTSL
jgi:hypothetical protein